MYKRYNATEHVYFILRVNEVMGFCVFVGTCIMAFCQTRPARILCFDLSYQSCSAMACKFCPGSYSASAAMSCQDCEDCKPEVAACQDCVDCEPEGRLQDFVNLEPASLSPNAELPSPIGSEGAGSPTLGTHALARTRAIIDSDGNEIATDDVVSVPEDWLQECVNLGLASLSPNAELASPIGSMGAASPTLGTRALARTRAIIDSDGNEIATDADVASVPSRFAPTIVDSSDSENSIDAASPGSQDLTVAASPDCQDTTVAAFQDAEHACNVVSGGMNMQRRCTSSVPCLKRARPMPLECGCCFAWSSCACPEAGLLLITSCPQQITSSASDANIAFSASHFPNSCGFRGQLHNDL
jgi:hypothetical protein